MSVGADLRALVRSPQTAGLVRLSSERGTPLCGKQKRPTAPIPWLASQPLLPLWQRPPPACAGETTAWVLRVIPKQPAARVCGGNEETADTLYGADSRRPRVRGKRTALDNGSVAMRYIPACAGEAGAAGIRRSRRKVHPRVCGGSVIGGSQRSAHMGTSPRVRGKPASVEPYAGYNGYIPACAGEAPAIWPGTRI